MGDGGGGLSDKREEEKTTGTLRPLISRAPQTNGHLVGEKKNKRKELLVVRLTHETFMSPKKNLSLGNFH